MIGRTTNVIPDTPQHLSEFDGRYMRDFEGEIIMRPPDDPTSMLLSTIPRVGS